jgi:hypothetical protein
MRNYPEVGVQVGEILLPKDGIDLKKWAVIACDQYTSQPEYWQNVQESIGDSPSTLNLILPEVYLGAPDEAERIKSTQKAMRQYVNEDLLAPHHGLILVERTVNSAQRTKKRYGLMMALDLEHYDFRKGSQSLIRATEGTILERLPPRIRIREGALLELPHILVLIDDPERTVIEPLVQARARLPRLYDTELTGDSGRLSGYLVDQQDQEAQVIEGLRRLANPQRFRQHYGVGEEKGVLLFAAGDGNHSLATAKSIWEQIKTQVDQKHPARYALVEVENVHDEGLDFEPIHRVLFGVRPEWQTALRQHFGERLRLEPSGSMEAMIAAVENQHGPAQSFGAVSGGDFWVVTVEQPPTNLAVGTLQGFLDQWLANGGAQQIDYVHGDEVVQQLGAREGNLGFYLPTMDKSELFKTVILDGSLPRKTFSMGEAHEKRFYMESRRIAS